MAKRASYCCWCEIGEQSENASLSGIAALSSWGKRTPVSSGKMCGCVLFCSPGVGPVASHRDTIANSVRDMVHDARPDR